MSVLARARRILVVTNMWPADERDYTGIFVREQVEALRRAASHWTFDVLEIAGRRGRVDYLVAVPRVRRALRRGYDAVHAHYGLTGATVALARPSAPLLITLHGNDVNWGWQLPISRIGARRAAEVIAVSEQLRRSFGHERTRVLPCGVATDRFRPLDRSAARARLGIRADAVVVLFPAHPDNPIKDHALFRAALDALPPVIQERVVERTLGAVPPADVPLEMAVADVVVLTSVAEGSPMVVKEALACGTPVVSVDVGDVRRVLEGLPGCAIVARDAGALAAAIEASVVSGVPGAEGPATAERRRRVFELGLDAEAIARELLGTYDAAISRSANGRPASVPAD
ncbi:MAG TPA: glycosyltransferase [Longimicrobiales bacterium]|nr:glycosyltransferase [Longimicrobiales bacterium]